MIRIGLDVGSTTLKCVVLNDRDEILYKNYERHYSQITQKAAAMLSEVRDQFPEQERVQLCVSGSAGMGFAESMSIPFAQEVYATRVAIRRNLPETDVVIELGGEEMCIRDRLRPGLPQHDLRAVRLADHVPCLQRHDGLCALAPAPARL